MVSEGMLRHTRYIGPVVGYMAVIFLMSALPGDKVPVLGIDFGDKLIHLLEYGLLGIFLYRAFRFGLGNSNPYTLTVIVGALYAASDEFHQSFVPGRFAGWGDWVADLAGIIVFACISALANRKR